MRRNAATKLFTLLLAFLLMVTAIPTGNLTTWAAAKKPGAVTKIKKVEVNPTTVTVTYNKAKYAKGYQVRTYKGKKLVKSIKTKNTSCTVKGLSAETKYTIKVRAYNGSKYGKEKSLTLKTETKNLAVTGLKVSSVTEESIKVKYNKAKNAKGYQIRVYKGSKRVAEVKTKNTSCMIDKLSAGTEYTVKIRAYKGKKYGKEKSIAVRTSKEAPDSGDQAEDDTPGIVMPGESTSTGDALVAEYNAYIAYEAGLWKNKPAPAPDPVRDWYDEFSGIPWDVNIGHMGSGYQYVAENDDKYSLFKYKAGTPNAVIDMTVDILNTMGVPAEKHDVANDIDRFHMNGIYSGIIKPGDPYYDYYKENYPYTILEPGDPGYKDATIIKGLVLTLPSGNRWVFYIDTSFSYTGCYNLTEFENGYVMWTIDTCCPTCGEKVSWELDDYTIREELYREGVFSIDKTIYHDCKGMKDVPANYRIKEFHFKKTFTKDEVLAARAIHRFEFTAEECLIEETR